MDTLNMIKLARHLHLLVESSDGCTMIVWAGALCTVAIFPRLEDPVARSWQAMIINHVIEITDARTFDDIVREAL